MKLTNICSRQFNIPLIGVMNDVAFEVKLVMKCLVPAWGTIVSNHMSHLLLVFKFANA
jgi:hypothetical protein